MLEKRLLEQNKLDNEDIHSLALAIYFLNHLLIYEFVPQIFVKYLFYVVDYLLCSE